MHPSAGVAFDRLDNIYDWVAFLQALTIDNGIVVTEDISHYLIHEGRRFFIAGYETENVGAVIEFVVTTPDTDVDIRMRFKIGGTQQTTMQIYRDPTGVVGGTPGVPINNNEKSNIASVLTVVKDPAAIGGDGTLIYGQSVGGNRETGLLEEKEEMILRRNTSYLYRMTSGANGNVISYYGMWAEVPG